jgi:ABC-type nitrate/sulfonate/bicarbonate transport system substrate-binding protein
MPLLLAGGATMGARRCVVSALVLWLLLGCQLAAPAAKPAAPAATAPQPAGQAAAPTQPQAAAPAAPAPPSPPTKATLAITSPNMIFALPWLAQDSGIFARHGWDVEVIVVGGSPRATQSLVAGDFDFAISGISSLLRARMQGADTWILATSSNIATSQKIMVMPQSGIRMLADLRGKTVGITQYGSEAHNFIVQALEKGGLGPDDARLLQLGASPQVAAALLTGGIDAGVNSGPAGLAAERSGAVTVVSATELNILAPAGSIATTRRYIDRDRAAIQRFMRAYVEAVHMFKTNRAETLRILQPHLGGLPLDELDYLYDEVADSIQPLPAVREDAVQAVLDREDDPLSKSFKPSDFLDMSFLREIEQSGFLASLYR